jgi:hypothetical protein
MVASCHLWFFAILNQDAIQPNPLAYLGCNASVIRLYRTTGYYGICSLGNGLGK